MSIDISWLDYERIKVELDYETLLEFFKTDSLWFSSFAPVSVLSELSIDYPLFLLHSLSCAKLTHAVSLSWLSFALSYQCPQLKPSSRHPTDTSSALVMEVQHTIPHISMNMTSRRTLLWYLLSFDHSDESEAKWLVTWLYRNDQFFHTHLFIPTVSTIENLFAKM